MTTLNGVAVDDAAQKIAEATNLQEEAVRKAIADAMRIGPLDRSFGFLTFNGLLPVNLPDGTRVAVLPDLHVPAHNKKVIWAVKAFLKDFQPHIIVLIGDVADVFALSRWPSPPRVVKNMQKELDEARRLVDEFIRISGCLHVFWIMGNHEDRAFRYLTDPAAGVANILDFKTHEPILSFHGLMGYGPKDPVTFVYDLHEKGGYGGGIVVNDDMEFHHGYIVRPQPGASPRADVDRTGRSTAHGHTHRAGFSARETTLKGVLRAYELGHLVDPEHDYLGYANLLNNWHMAVGAGFINGGKVHLKVLPVKQVKIDGQRRFALTFAGKVYVQSDR